MKNVSLTLFVVGLLMLASCNGGGNTSTLIIEPSNASTTASGKSITLTARGASEVSWSLSPELGSLSATSGTSVTYKPPERVESAHTVTVTATSGNLSTSASITVEPLIINVAGTVLSIGGSPISGALVAVAGKYPVATDANGRFEIYNVIAPYTIIIQNNVLNYYVYNNLIKNNPVLYSHIYGPKYTASINIEIDNTTNNNLLGLELLSNNAIISEIVNATSGTTSHTLNAYLFSGSAAGNLYALEWTEDANGNVVEYTGYAKTKSPFAILNGQAVNIPRITLSPVSTRSISVVIDTPTKTIRNTFAAGIRFSKDGYAWPLIVKRETNPGASLNVLSPNLENAFLQATALAEIPVSNSLTTKTNKQATSQAVSEVYGYVWDSVPVADDNLKLKFPPRPELLEPVENASIDPSTVFKWSGNDNNINIVYFDGPVTITYFTNNHFAKLPDLSAFGITYKSGNSFLWNVKQLHLGSLCNNLNQYTNYKIIQPDLLYLSIINFKPVSYRGYWLHSRTGRFTIR